MSTGDAVTISLDPDLIEIARGFIIELEPVHITVGFDHEVDLNRILQRSRPVATCSSSIVAVSTRMCRPLGSYQILASFDWGTDQRLAICCKSVSDITTSCNYDASLTFDANR